MTLQDFQFHDQLPWGLCLKDKLILFDLNQISPWMLLLAEISLPHANDQDLQWLPTWLAEIKQNNQDLAVQASQLQPNKIHYPKR